jgi:hypothetical protein
MGPLTLDSEDFFYWSPEDIQSYPLPPGPEDAWFIDRSRTDRPGTTEETPDEQ